MKKSKFEMKGLNIVISLIMLPCLVFPGIVLMEAYNQGVFLIMLSLTLACATIGAGLVTLVFGNEFVKHNRAFWNLSDMALEIAKERDELRKQLNETS